MSLNSFAKVVLMGTFILFPSLVVGILWSKSKEFPVKDGDNYGVDVTFPIHHKLDSSSMYGKAYDRMMKGCYDKYSRRECDMTEEQRLDQCLEQPRQHHNYTELGFMKMKVPEQVWSIVHQFWEDNKANPNRESWPRGNTYTNHWESPTEFVSVEDPTRKGGGQGIKDMIWNGLKPTLSEWVGGEQLMPTSLYGIRLYRRGAILSTHVDRLPLVTSAIIQVAQEGMDEPWPIEVYSHDGKAYNFTMQPGEMVLYESHTVLHGRPFPLKGDLYANIFVHFKPIRHDQINAGAVDPSVHPPPRKLRKASSVTGEKDHKDQHGYHQDHGETEQKNIVVEEDHDLLSKFGGKKHSLKDDHELISNHRKRRERALAMGKSGNHKDGSAGAISAEIVYISPPLSSKLSEYLKEKDRDDLQSDEGEGSVTMRSILHQMAQSGDVETTIKLLKGKDDNEREVLVNAEDSRGWRPIHEAIRGGHLPLVKFFVEDCGASFEARTGKFGGTPLWWAKKLLDPRHPIVGFLMDLGAPEEGDNV